MASTTELEAQLAVARLEEELVKVKDTAKGPDRKLKAELREARLRYRAARDGLEVITDERGRVLAVGGEEG